jgi:hypothetical protein
MEASGAKVVIADGEMGETQRRLGELFGSYKAEWLNERIFDLFTTPEYWPELETNRPCMLVGGRGTGKTTVLRGLSYEGQYALNGSDPGAARGLSYVGFYERVDTNRVRAFAGPELHDERWDRVFAHYLNLTMVARVAEFAAWYRGKVGGEDVLSTECCGETALSLNLNADAVTDVDSLRSAVRHAIVRFEASVNNIGEETQLHLSMQKAPVDAVMAGLEASLPGRQCFFILDEYENFSERQQRVVNTLIKHGGANWTFKIGVRELGLRSKETINADEQLNSPADYVHLNVGRVLSGAKFREFALQVCGDRLTAMRAPGFGQSESPQRSLPELLQPLTKEAEAERLGIAAVLKREKASVLPLLTSSEREVFEGQAPLWQLVALRKSPVPAERVQDVQRYLADRSAWKNRVNNYGYALLFSLRKGQGAGGVQKYYAGWDTYCTMAAGNIRYLLELVEQALLLHVRRGGALTVPVSAEDQTSAAQAVGRKNLGELEGLSVHGARLTKLVLSLGRVFQLFALDPEGHTSELNEFEIEGDVAPVDELVTSAVKHLALLRAPGTKMSSDPGDTRDFDYRLHPIFSAFFLFSHRKKRKFALTASDLLALTTEPGHAISAVVSAQNRDADADLPAQLELFSEFYGVGSA